jgi:ubiquitin-conjugating enzyme E2 variant
MSAALALIQHPTLPSFKSAGKALLQTGACVAAADLLVGAVHWWEDAYANPEWPVLGPLVAEPNLLHHRDPRAMTRQSWWKNVDLTVFLGAAVLGAAALLHHLCWQLALVVTMAALTNLVHRFAHQTEAENGPAITWLQKHGVLQSRAQHAVHHRWPRESHYCALTGFVNPVVERLHLWEGLEFAIARTTGIQRRREPRPGLAA